MNFVVVRETSLPGLLWRAFLGRRPVVVEVDPIVPELMGLFRWMVGALAARGLVGTLEADFPDLIPFTDINDVHRYTDTYRTTEPWQREYFGFVAMDGRLGDDAYPYRDLVGNYLQARLLMLFRLRAIARHPEHGQRAISGVSHDVRALYRARFGEVLPGRSVSEGRGLINLIYILGVGAFSLGWIASRMRLRLAARRRFFLASDFVADPRDEILWRELDDAPDPILVVFRNRRQEQDWKGRLAWDHVGVREGRFDVRPGFAAMGETLGRLARLWMSSGDRAPALFRLMAFLPFKRMVFRALFHRFQIDHFWGRDDYNVEHMLRSQELRRVGGRSIGISHGYHVVSSVLQQTRHVDYDLYYVFGAKLCGRHLVGEWPKTMTVKPIGTFAYSRTAFQNFPCQRPHDIGFILVPSRGSDRTFAALLDIARAFPERRLYVNVKEKYRVGTYLTQLEAMLAQAPGNIVEWRTDQPGRQSYDIFERVTYLLSEPSTMVVEAIQLGLYGFVLDLDPDWRVMTFREMPDLIVRDAAQAIARIRDLEAGRWVYPRSQLADNIELSGRVTWDIIRADLGLSCRQPPLRHLAFAPAAA